MFQIKWFNIMLFYANSLTNPIPYTIPLPLTELTEKVRIVKWINSWTLMTGLLRNIK